MIARMIGVISVSRNGGDISLVFMGLNLFFVFLAWVVIGNRGGVYENIK